ncbi:MAG: glycerol-3-phosphate 1-O-acyltransferase PlsY [Pelotomaculum sp.]|uniref:Glycerol-3-phosphate acyltransferase n=1 Tax=Pelotomaculum thermopropionicum (strain DSM 13744 / JCM 10971 / SI) TaxID=370438 RepID=A5D1U5_PELTS|nr:glycerol-3-phosphate 1-O-acyltransferase PlsY [Pelotomaculum sp.]BAF59789.1 predicted membrane protein [Pelotomaculum thermopropionicum SI]
MSDYWVVIASYLIGSIPFSYLVARYGKGIDIRRLGSGNVGTTNVWRNAGPAAGIIALAGDAGKGLLAVELAHCFGGPLLVCLSAMAVLAGHSWPVFLGFKGGKLIATGLGVIIALSLPVAVLAFAVWLLVVGISRYVSAGSILAAVSVPFLMLAFHLEGPYLAVGAFVAVFAVYKHIPNIKRLVAGTEPRISLKKDLRR